LYFSGASRPVSTGKVKRNPYRDWLYGVRTIFSAWRWS
jgi:hypothetical protein